MLKIYIPRLPFNRGEPHTHKSRLDWLTVEAKVPDSSALETVDVTFHSVVCLENLSELNLLLDYYLSPELSPQVDALDDIDAAQHLINQYDEKDKKAVVKARIGQGRFRDSLIEVWKGACAVSDVTNERLLVASHIKPWAKCELGEHLDPMNGILLAAPLDKLFDVGLISFNSDGTILVSSKLSRLEKEVFGVNENLRLKSVSPKCEACLEYHRECVFA